MKEKQYNKIERQLSWYYNNSAADAFKFSSGFGAFITACYKIIVPTDPDNISDSQLRYIKKFRRIHTILRSLPIDTQRALRSMYDYEVAFRYPLVCIIFYGHKVGLSFFNNHFNDLLAFEKFLRKRQQSKLTPEEQLISFKIGREIEELYSKIHNEYQTAANKYDKR